MNTRVDSGRNDDYNEQYLSQVSTFEGLMIQALIGQATDIVESQGRGRRISYENAYKQALTLQALAQTALMLTDSESLFLHAEKIQGFVNRAFLEHSLRYRGGTNEPTDHESRA